VTAFEANKRRRDERGSGSELTNNDLALAFFQGVMALSPIALLIWWFVQ
jgi:hypothetical protein